MNDARTGNAAALMRRFAERTGLDGDPRQRRYLWTDAFAVCNFLGLAEATGEEHYRELARRLIDAVHHSLGRQRPDAPTSGWLSGLDAEEGERHPTRGGLRIGKPLPERRTDEPFDERLEWDRDGQYFHYLTKWMHALDQFSRHSGDPRFNRWGRELADTAWHAFSYPVPGDGRRLYWKMSIDLSRPLVASMGMHDPLDGHITWVQLMATAARLSAAGEVPVLEEQARELAAMIDPAHLATTDPLGLGGLLADAGRLAQLVGDGVYPGDELLVALLGAASSGLDYYARSGEWQQPAAYRLAFRELGLAIGLQANDLMRAAVETAPQHFGQAAAIVRLLDELDRHAVLRERIEAFWLEPAHQQATTWKEHLDINEVMLATSLAPRGFLVLHAPQY